MPANDKTAANQQLQSIRLSQVADATPDAILSMGTDQLITYANPAALEMFRCSAEHMVGTSIERFIPERYRSNHAAQVLSFGQQQAVSRQMAGQRSISGLRADGTEFPIEASISHVDHEQTRVFTVILRDITARIEAQEELNRARLRLRQLTARLQNVREEEHRHLARELHDDIGQRLSVIKMDLARLKNELPAETTTGFDVLDQADEMLNDTVAAVRGLATGLRPKILDDLGLAAALDSFLQEIEHRYKLKCRLQIDDQIEIAGPVGINLFRIVQEAVHNACKHARASHCEVSLVPHEDALELTITDDGIGMQGDDQDKDSSLGILGLRERVAGLNGTFTLTSRPGAGTRISCHFPATSTSDPAAPG